MLPHFGSRLAVTVVMLLLQSFIFLFELLVFSKPVRQAARYRPLRQLFVPISISILATVLIPVTFANSIQYIDVAGEQCSASVDGEIAGQGAQIAVWAQVGVLLVISVLGSFHTSATGAKEVGAGLVLTHASLSIALLAQMRLGTLSPADAIVGSMILDAQNAGLSIQLAAKETLASRWQVHFVVLAQIFGLVVIPLLVSNFHHGTFSSDDCRCLTVFWWAWLSSCGSTAAREMPIFWTYYACRCIAFIQSSFHSLYNTSKFDKSEKSERAVANTDSWNEASDTSRAAVDEEQQLVTGPLREAEEQRDDDSHKQPRQAENLDQEEILDNRGKCTNRGSRLRRVTHLYSQNEQPACFSEYPATVTLMYAVYGAFSLTSLAIAQTTVINFNMKPPSPIDSVGQIISLIVAAATLGRAAWLFFMLFRDETRRGEWNFVWPFKWRVNHERLRYLAVGEDYVFCSPPSHKTNLLLLGALMTEPFDPTSQLGAQPAPPEGIKNEEKGPGGFIVSSPATFRSLTHCLQSQKVKRDQIHVKWIKTSSFEPSTRLVASCVEGRVHSLRAAANEGSAALYMVTGIKIAERVRIVREIAEKMVLRVGNWNVKDVRYSTDGQVLLAYRLHMIRWCHETQAFVLNGVYNPKEDW